MPSSLSLKSVSQAIMRQATSGWPAETSDHVDWAAARVRLETLYRMTTELCTHPPQDADSPLWHVQLRLRTLMDLTQLRARQPPPATTGARDGGEAPASPAPPPDLRELRESALI